MHFSSYYSRSFIKPSAAVAALRIPYISLQPRSTCQSASLVSKYKEELQRSVQHSFRFYRFYSSISYILIFSAVFRLPSEDPIRAKQAVEVLSYVFTVTVYVLIHIKQKS